MTFFTQRNFKFHLVVMVCVVAVSIYLKLAAWEWAYLATSICMVLVAEVFNSALEVLVDLVTKKRKFRAKLAKDMAAGAVLLTAVHAIIAGLFIFGPKLLALGML